MRNTLEMANEAATQTPPMLNGSKAVIQITTDTGAILHWSWTFQMEFLARFEALVRADERKACAKVCENIESDGHPTIEQQQCADAIRARGAKNDL